MSIQRKVWLLSQYCVDRLVSHLRYIDDVLTTEYLFKCPVHGFGHFHHIATVLCCGQSTFVDKHGQIFLHAGCLVVLKGE